MVDAPDFRRILIVKPFYYQKSKLSASGEIQKVESDEFRETLTDNADGNPEPSL